ncbi:hypothetical protein DL96DRAFT_1816444 [Flagelloscypha sp. PMI_526]|nr:hypothetical protein DL96DRAFT_1816444 [Flagelloscypha sp. PMI_526]
MANGPQPPPEWLCTHLANILQIDPSSQHIQDGFELADAISTLASFTFPANRNFIMLKAEPPNPGASTDPSAPQGIPGVAGAAQYIDSPDLVIAKALDSGSISGDTVVAVLNHYKEEFENETMLQIARERITRYMSTCGGQRRLTRMRGYVVLGEDTEIYHIPPGRPVPVLLKIAKTTGLFSPGSTQTPIGSMLELAERAWMTPLLRADITIP